MASTDTSKSALCSPALNDSHRRGIHNYSVSDSHMTQKTKVRQFWNIIKYMIYKQFREQKN